MRGIRDVVFPSGGGGTAGADGGIGISASGSSQSAGNIVFENGSGVTFGMSGSTITASVAAVGGAQTGISGIVGSDATYTSGSVYFSNLANVTIGSSVNGASQYIRLSGNAAQTVQGVAASAAGGSVSFNTLSFSNVNGVSFVTAAGPAIQASVRTDYLSSGSSTLFVQAGAAFAGTSASGTIASNGISVSIGPYITTAMASNRASDFVQATAAFAGTNATGTIASNGISVSVAASHAVQTGISGVIVSDATYTSGSVYISGVGAITASSSVNGASQYIRLSVAAQSAQAAQTGISGIIVSDASYTSGTVSFSNAGNITISSSVNGATQYIRLSGHAAQTAQSGISGLIVSDATYTTGTVSFSNAGNITISSSVNGATQYIKLSGNAAQTTQSAIKGLGVSNTGNTAGNTGLVSGVDWVVAGSNNVTISQSTSAGGPNTIWVSGPTVGGLQTGISGVAVSDTTYTSGTLYFSNAGNITISSSVNGASQYIRLSVGAGGGGGVGAGVSTGGNTAGSTGTVTTGNIIFVGSGPISLSQSTGAAGSAATVSIIGPATSSLVGTSGISVSTNGSTISVQEIPVSQWDNAQGIIFGGTLQGNSLVSILPFRLEILLAFSNILVAGSNNVATAANNSSAYKDLSISGVVYTRNVSTLSSLFSFSNSMTETWSSNNTASVTGFKGISATCVATTLTRGEYWLALHISTNSTTTGGAATTVLAHSLSMALAYSAQSNNFKMFGQGLQTSDTLGIQSGLGIISTGATRATIAFSDYVVTGSRGHLANVFLGLRNATFQ